MSKTPNTINQSKICLKPWKMPKKVNIFRKKQDLTSKHSGYRNVGRVGDVGSDPTFATVKDINETFQKDIKGQVC